MKQDFRTSIASIHQVLLNVSEQESQCTCREGGWTRKEILGHLIDSALNNHQRFVRAALDGAYAGPGYEQDEWVALHGYKSMPWGVLVQHWRWQNELLCEVVQRIPDTRLGAPCRIGNGEPVTLSFLIQDYLDHMQHHLQQIVA
jgi:DinB superfamily